MSHAFISHGAEDLDTLLEVHEVLRQAGIPTRYVTATNGDLAREEADRLIDEASFLIVLVSASAMNARSMRADIERARASGVSVLPIRVDRGRLSGFMRTYLAHDLRISLLDDGGLADLAEEARKLYRRRCPVVAVMNLKGGVGKTTVAAQVSAAIQSHRLNRVLLIDLDPQYNLTQLFFSMNAADRRAADDRSVISLFERSRVHHSDLPSPADDWSRISTDPFTLAERGQLVQALFDEDGPEGRLDLITGQFELSKYAFSQEREALTSIRGNFMRSLNFYRSFYDLIVLDTNPTATFLTQCALEAAELVLAPMHTNIYSLRGVKLLNKIMAEHVSAEHRPGLSVIFNAVGRSEQSNFEADTRNGIYDKLVDFKLSQAVLTHPLPRSNHLNVRQSEDETPAWQRLAIHHGRGGGLRAIRENLTEIAAELEGVLANAT